MMNESAAALYNYLMVGGLLFAIGAIGFLVRRNMIVMFLSTEIMLQGVSISLIAWSRFHNDWGGQMLVIFAIAVAACEAGLALALVLTLYHERGTLDITAWQQLREEGQPAFVDRKVPEQSADAAIWPTLTPAGVRPVVDEDELVHRSRV
jgi:NADH-quinone oxidoreductase subunit K